MTKTETLDGCCAMCGQSLKGKERSAAQHNWYWALVRKVAENSDRFETPQQLHSALKPFLGYGEWVPSIEGSTMEFAPKSITKMKHLEFNQYCRDTVDAIQKYIIPGIDKAALVAEIEAFYIDERNPPLEKVVR